MNNSLYNVFGSSDSEDYDVIVFIPFIPSVSVCKRTCMEHDESLSTSNDFKDKKVNTNLAVMGNGKIIDCYKGTPDEVNNSVFFTYNFHNQTFPLVISELAERDVSLKIARSARIILSFLSRTKYRSDVKRALRSKNFSDKLDAILAIDIASVEDLGNNNFTITDFYKTLAFQIGQTISLIDGDELYTKSSVSEKYDDLTPFLNRVKGIDAAVMNNYVEMFVGKIKSYCSSDFDSISSIKEHTNWRG